MMHDEYGVLNWFIKKAMDDSIIPVFGDGMIKRDFLFIDDLVTCMLMTACAKDAVGEVFNIGCGIPVTFRELAQKIAGISKTGSYNFTEFTKERAEVEPGDYWADISKIKKIVGWEPVTDLENGIKKTVDFYRKFKEHYWSENE